MPCTHIKILMTLAKCQYCVNFYNCCCGTNNFRYANLTVTRKPFDDVRWGVR
jgi:hypothetical protein